MTRKCVFSLPRPAGFYALKSPARFEDMFDALDGDTAANIVNYPRLFEEDEQLNQVRADGVQHCGARVEGVGLGFMFTHQ